MTGFAINARSRKHVIFYWSILNSNSSHVQLNLIYLERRHSSLCWSLDLAIDVSARVIIARCLNFNRHFDCQLTNTAICWTQTISPKYRWAVGAVQMQHHLLSWCQLASALLSKPQTVMVVSYLSHEFVAHSSLCHLRRSQKSLIRLSKTICIERWWSAQGRSSLKRREKESCR